MKPARRFRPMLPALLLAAALPAPASQLRTGAFQVIAADAGATVVESGVALDCSAGDLVGGRLRVRCGAAETVHLMSSAGVDFFLRGPGNLAVERFDQLRGAGGAAEWYKLAISIDGGLLAVGGEAPGGLSSLQVITPVGRVVAAGGRWWVTVDHDQLAGVYRLSVEVFSGSLTFAARDGRTFELFRGQRLVGSGDPNQLKLELATVSRDSEEFAGTLAAAAEAAHAAFDFDAFLPRMAVLGEWGGEARTAGAADGIEASLMIENFPRARSFYPIRGRLAGTDFNSP